MNELINTFNFEGSNINIIVKDGEPWFCAKDVCDALGYQNARDALPKHCSPKGVAKHDLVKTLSNGRQQTFQMTFVDERNLYRLIMRSKLESAVRFQDWVCGEVLPQIRKTGSYGQALDTSKLLSDPSFLRQALLVNTEKVLQLEKQVGALAKQIEEDAPINAYARKVSEIDGATTLTIAAKHVDIPPMTYRQIVKNLGWLRRDGYPQQFTINKKWMRVRVFPLKHKDGTIEEKFTPLITTAGEIEVARRSNFTFKDQPTLFSGE